MVFDTGRYEKVFAVAFHPDGKHLLGGGNSGIRRWQLADGREVGKQTGVRLRAICVSKDRKWVVCGTHNGASVWDGELQEKIIDVEGRNGVWAVDISPDSTRFATGTHRFEAIIWSIQTGKRLVGPLQHDDAVTGVKFSPSGEHIATAGLGNYIRIFESRNGDELINIRTITPRLSSTTPIAWSSNGLQIFAASDDNKIRSFDVSTGSQLADLQIHNDYYRVPSIALPADGKFIATFVYRSISFLDASTLTRIGPVIEDDDEIWSIAVSPDSSRVATGRHDGKIVIRRLNSLLPDVYGPFHVSICALVVLACCISPILSLTLTNYVGIHS